MTSKYNEHQKWDSRMSRRADRIVREYNLADTRSEIKREDCLVPYGGFLDLLGKSPKGALPSFDSFIGYVYNKRGQQVPEQQEYRGELSGESAKDTRSLRPLTLHRAGREENMSHGHRAFNHNIADKIRHAKIGSIRERD